MPCICPMLCLIMPEPIIPAPLLFVLPIMPFPFIMAGWDCMEPHAEVTPQIRNPANNPTATETTLVHIFSFTVTHSFRYSSFILCIRAVR